jgi:hypothetical protein
MQNPTECTNCSEYHKKGVAAKHTVDEMELCQECYEKYLNWLVAHVQHNIYKDDP